MNSEDTITSPDQATSATNSSNISNGSTAAATDAPVCSVIPASVGRELHLYGRRLHHNHRLVPQPCQVVFAHAEPEAVKDGADQTVNVNANIDALQFPDMLHGMRLAQHGSTIPSLRVYDPLTDEQRSRLAESNSYWCEWPPRV